MFVAYLRGIETAAGRNCGRSGKRFVAYLRGIETQLLDVAAIEVDEFIAYLRGIETWEGSMEDVLRRCL